MRTFQKEKIDDEPPINISAYRPLYIYMLLCQYGQLTLEELNTFLTDNPRVSKIFSAETFHKYIQTLRVFGCNISRLDKQGEVWYQLEDHPLKMHASTAQLNAMQAVLGILRTQPLKNTYRSICQLFKNMVFCKETANSQLALLQTFSGSLDTYAKVEQFQTYCSEGQMLEIYCKPEDSLSASLLVEPMEVIVEKNRLFLLGSDPKTGKKIRCHLDHIYSHKQLPNRVRAQIQKVVVTFKIMGRLANNYRPYPGETIVTQDDFLLVQHKTDETEQLLKRLLKYGTQCEVLSPGFVRQDMASKIEALLDSMEAPLTKPQLALFSTEQINGSLQKWLDYSGTQQTWDGAVVD